MTFEGISTVNKKFLCLFVRKKYVTCFICGYLVLQRIRERKQRFKQILAKSVDLPSLSTYFSVNFKLHSRTFGLLATYLFPEICWGKRGEGGETETLSGGGVGGETRRVEGWLSMVGGGRGQFLKRFC